MTIVGVVSDTHLPHFGLALPRALERGLREAGVTQILHCGDHTEPLTIDLFEAIAPFDAVAGNNDGRELQKRFGDRKILTVGNARIGMIHGHYGRGRNAQENALASFTDEEVDIILFGHSHRPVTGKHGRILYANPGSPTDKRMNPLYSYAILTIDDAEARIDLKYYASRSAE